MISLVYAVSNNGVIGKSGGLPWQVPSDLKQFKAVTLGKPVIMGRKTWESLPRKALPGRHNIVISRQAGFVAQGADVVFSLADALVKAGAAAEICVIGGAELLTAFLPSAGKIYLTRILADVEGDTFMPELTTQEWREISRQRHLQGERDSAAFETIIYERR